jgi:membrane-associated phospholipid phosphatase
MRKAKHGSCVVALVLYFFAASAAAQDVGRLPVATLGVQSSPKEAPADRPINHTPWLESVLKTFGRDVLRLPSKSTAITLGIGGAAAWAVHPVDRRVTQEVSASVGFDRTLEIGEPIGSGWIQVGGAVGAVLIGHIAGRPRLQHVGADLTRAQAVNALLTQALKVSVRRARPDGSQYSFPSGHASASFATATVLQRHLGWKVGAPAYALAGFVAASRLQENKHFASDVIFGAAVGIVAGRTVTIGRGSARFAVSPVIVPGGAGVMVGRVAVR